MKKIIITIMVIFIGYQIFSGGVSEFCTKIVDNRVVCSFCEGSGVCKLCDGTGQRPYSRCRSCNGSGKCSWCDGQGKVTESRQEENNQEIMRMRNALSTMRNNSYNDSQTSGVCSYCNGTGRRTDRCTYCGGSGINSSYELFKKSVALAPFADKNCPSCGGYGYKACYHCGGSGKE